MRFRFIQLVYSSGEVVKVICGQPLSIKLRDGESLTLYSEDLEVDGRVEYSAEENLWVAVIDWNAIKEQPVPTREADEYAA